MEPKFESYFPVVNDGTKLLWSKMDYFAIYDLTRVNEADVVK